MALTPQPIVLGEVEDAGIAAVTLMLLKKKKRQLKAEKAAALALKAIGAPSQMESMGEAPASQVPPLPVHHMQSQLA